MRRVTRRRCRATSRGAMSSTECAGQGWLQLRAPSRVVRPQAAGVLSIDPQVTRLDDVATPSFLARRQQRRSSTRPQLRVPRKRARQRGSRHFRTRRIGTSSARVASARASSLCREEERRAAGDSCRSDAASATQLSSGSAATPAYSFLCVRRTAGVAASQGERRRLDPRHGCRRRVRRSGRRAVCARGARLSRSESELRSARGRSRRRMTLEEKIAQLGNNAPAIPRLGVPQCRMVERGVARRRARRCCDRCSRRPSASPQRSIVT